MSASETGIADFAITDHGLLVLFQPLTDHAREWWHENVNDDAPTWGGAWVVERRYVDTIVNGIIDDGLEIEV
jgi:hypothetical protein